MEGFKKTKPLTFNFNPEVKWHEKRTKQTLPNKTATAKAFL